MVRLTKVRATLWLGHTQRPAPGLAAAQSLEFVLSPGWLKLHVIHTNIQRPASRAIHSQAALLEVVPAQAPGQPVGQSSELRASGLPDTQGGESGGGPGAQGPHGSWDWLRALPGG